MGIREHFAEAALGSGDAPSPLPGMDGATYRNFLARALSGDESVPAAVLSRVRVTNGENGTENQKTARQSLQDFIWRRVIDQRLDEIDHLIAQYNAMADWHRDQAEAARGRMQGALDKMAEIGEFISGVNEILKEREGTGKLDREKAAQFLRTRGIDIDPDMDEAALVAALTAEKNKAIEEHGLWGNRFEDADTEAKRHGELERENRRKAEELVERRDTIRTGGYKAEEEALRLKRLEDEYIWDVRNKANKIEEKKAEANVTEAGTSVAAPTTKTTEGSQDQNEEADFLASSNALTGTFNEVAANRSPETPEPDEPRPGGTAPSGPAMKV